MFGRERDTRYLFAGGEAISRKFQRLLGTRSAVMCASATQLIESIQRIFSYADNYDWCLNAIALVASIGAGATLPLMTLVFGQFVAKFNAFQSDQGSPDAFRSDISDFV